MRDWTAVAAQHPDRFIRLPSGRWMPVLGGGKGGGGGGTTTTVVQAPAKSQEELDLLKKQNELLDLQVQEVKRQNDALAAVFPQQQQLLKVQTETAISLLEAQKRETTRIEKLAEAQAPLLEEQTALAREQAAVSRQILAELAKPEPEKTAAEKEIEELSTKRTLAILRGESPPLAPGQEAKINELFGAAEAEGTRNIRQFAEELASSRGLRLTDTPVGNEVLRETTRFQEQLQGAKAGAKLAIGQEQQQFEEAVRQFQANLRQTAFQNRMALLGRSSGTAPLATLPLGTASNPVFATGSAGQAFNATTGLLDNLQRERLANTTTTSTTTGTRADYTAPLIGAAATLGAAAIPLFRSSATTKKDITPYDPDEYDRALRKLNDTPVTRWRYKDEPDHGRPHTGPILELSPDDIKADDRHLDLVSYVGLTHAGLKAVSRRVERVEALIAEKAKGRGRRRAAA